MVLVEKNLKTGTFSYKVKSSNGHIVLESLKKYDTLANCVIGIKAVHNATKQIKLEESVFKRKELL
jgi:uncharacterized protein YegP (UPF0339 family)